MSKRITVQFTVKPESVGDFEAVAKAATKRVQEEDKGCELYHLFKCVEDETKFVLVESWTTQEDLDAHGQSPAIADMQKIAPFLAARPVMHRYED